MFLNMVWGYIRLIDIAATSKKARAMRVTSMLWHFVILFAILFTKMISNGPIRANKESEISSQNITCDFWGRRSIQNTVLRLCQGQELRAFLSKLWRQPLWSHIDIEKGNIGKLENGMADDPYGQVKDIEIRNFRFKTHIPTLFYWPKRPVLLRF